MSTKLTRGWKKTVGGLGIAALVVTFAPRFATAQGVTAESYARNGRATSIAQGTGNGTLHVVTAVEDGDGFNELRGDFRGGASGFGVSTLHVRNGSGTSRNRLQAHGPGARGELYSTSMADHGHVETTTDVRADGPGYAAGYNTGIARGTYAGSSVNVHGYARTGGSYQLVGEGIADGLYHPARNVVNLRGEAEAGGRVMGDAYGVSVSTTRPTFSRVNVYGSAIGGDAYVSGSHFDD